MSVYIIDKLTNDLPEEVILYIDKFSKSSVWKLIHKFILQEFHSRNSQINLKIRDLAFVFHVEVTIIATVKYN